MVSLGMTVTSPQETKIRVASTEGDAGQLDLLKVGL